MQICVDTFRMFVKVRDVIALVRADGLCADKVAHCLLLRIDLCEGPVCVPLPVDFVTVNLQEQEETGNL